MNKHKINKVFKNDFFKRTIVILIIFLILFPSFFITKYLGKFGRISGLLFFMLLSSFATFEVLKNFYLNIYINIFLIVISNLIYFLSFENFEYLINKGIDNSLAELVNQFKLNYQILAFSIILAILLFVISLFYNKNKKIIDWVFIFISLLFIPMFGKFSFIFNVFNVWSIFIIGFIAAISDIFGLLGGKFFGNKIFKKKLAPNISPKKTWEGAIISTIFSTLFTFVCFYFTDIFNDMPNKLYFCLISSLILPIASIFGDLLFSSLKRYLKIKDFSNILSSHGGIMDRFDSTFLVVFTLIPILILFTF
ncbi:phosphatidate cytidylyltransferase [Mesomycoplasma molare]|uniref:Phosphatidate cytidylyltransferase n=1 Tax=Mesomycoplasma molare TaxID=171288 RepID=A0ABY5TUL0_9BACT|nr:phosphatidate cytidylyltransferase [Mesomycoplasma molare]UWD34333.1 phosphatidate cytidylyltransferase [Mesomycoplasma molare]